MGLIVRRGNPLALSRLSQLVRPGVRFVNRDPESGTRTLLDELLRREGVDPARITGFQQVEFTHAAVAAYVASGMADVSFGVEAAARQFDLDFVRLVTEDYTFVCDRQNLETAPLQRVLAVMRGAEFRAAIDALPGYSARDPGAVLSIDEVFSV